jgi:thiol-disulfide isomerase/thioredoxin
LSNEIRSFTADHRADKGALMGAFNFIQINHENLAQDLFPQTLRYIDAIDSGLSKRLERSASLNLIFDQKDSSRRAAMMGQFIRKFPTDPNILTVVGASFRYMRDSHDVIGAEKLFEGRKALEPDWADLYAGLASIYIDNNQKLDQALALLDYAEKLGPDGVHPPQRAAADYVVLGPDFGQSQAEIAYWRARAYVAQDHGDLALPFALKAEERKKNAARTFVVAQAYEAVGEKQKAVDKYFEALTMPSINSLEERERLEHLWLSGGFGSKESLEQKLREQQDETFRKANYTPRLVDRPVPEYEFTTLTNEKFTSANLHDRVVVLNMWGTWCAPCLPELPGFEALQKKHPEIFVALVAVSSEKDKINSLVARYKLGDLHIGQNEKMEDTFAASGVPVTYIIDHGRIRVIHQDSLSDVVAYLEADLNAMQKEIAQTSSSGAK